MLFRYGEANSSGDDCRENKFVTHNLQGEGVCHARVSMQEAPGLSQICLEAEEERGKCGLESFGFCVKRPERRGRHV